MSRFERLHPAIARALALWPERGTAERAAEVVERALAALPGDPGDAAWRASRLGQLGFPLELAFTAGPGGETSLRYTTEVDRPDRPADRRLASVLALAASLGEAGWPGEVVETLARLHRDHRDALTYGAWLGVRHRGELGLKLYAELPAPAGRILADELESTWGYRTWGGARPVLLGVERERLEVYYQALAPRPHELATVLERAGAGAARAPAVLALLERAYGLSLERGMPAPEVGFSYALGRDEEGEPRGLAFTLYHYADTVFGGDGAIRRGLLDLVVWQGADAGTYGAVSRPLEGRVGSDLHHGMFGIVLPRRGEPMLAFGLAPPHGSAH